MKSGGLCSGHWHRKMRYGSPGGAALRAVRGDQANRAPSRKSVRLTCEGCGEGFWCPPSLAYRDGQVIRRFCSNACYLAAKDPKPTLTCEACGKTVGRRKDAATQGYNYKQKFCSRACAVVAQGKGGHVHRGYRVIHVNGKAVFEHRHIVEQAIGRKLLPTETVHHISGDKLDNRFPENLEIWSGRHGKGQRASDHVEFAVETLKLYPELLIRRGYRLLPLESAASSEVLGKPSFNEFDAKEVISRIFSLGG